MLKVAEMLEHPLRSELTHEDHERLDRVMRGENVPVTREEMDALNDMLYDFIVAKTQTHPGSLTLQ